MWKLCEDLRALRHRLPVFAAYRDRGGAPGGRSGLGGGRGPLGRLAARREGEPAEQAARVGAVLEAEAELVVGKVTVGPLA